jgi:hypothetical protein
MISMMQPSGAIIFNQVGTAQKFRKKLFSGSTVEEVLNLSALRFGLFKNSLSPSCVITIRNILPSGEPLSYICPKPSHSSEDDYLIVIEPQDINEIYPEEAINDCFVWSVLMWGGRRDLHLIQQLSRTSNLAEYKKAGILCNLEGIKRGDRKQIQNLILEKRILNKPNFPEGTFLFLNSSILPINDDPELHSNSSANFSAFALPQLILKQSWEKDHKRFQAVLITSDNDEGILCSESYITVHTNQESSEILEAACLSYNSKVAVYYLLLSSGRFASYLPEPNLEDLLKIPIPKYSQDIIQNVETFDDIDNRVGASQFGTE